jgi:hypothetical protein
MPPERGEIVQGVKNKKDGGIIIKLEDETDTGEGLKALADAEGTMSLEEYMELRGNTIKMLIKYE